MRNLVFLSLMFVSLATLFFINDAVTSQTDPQSNPIDTRIAETHFPSSSLLDLLSSSSLFDISLNNYQRYFANQIRFIESQANSHNITATGEPVNDSLVGSLTLSFEGLDNSTQTLRESFKFTGTKFELAETNIDYVKTYLSDKLGPPLELPNDSRLLWPFHNDYHLELFELDKSKIEIRHHIPVGIKNMGQL